MKGPALLSRSVASSTSARVSNILRSSVARWSIAQVPRVPIRSPSRPWRNSPINEGDGFSYVVDGLTHGLEEALAISGIEPEPTPPPDLVQLAGQPLPEGHPLVGPHLDWSSELGRRTAELHLA